MAMIDHEITYCMNKLSRRENLNVMNINLSSFTHKKKMRLWHVILCDFSLVYIVTLGNR